MPPATIEWVKFDGSTLNISVVHDGMNQRRIYELSGHDIWEQLKESGAEGLAGMGNE